MCVCVCGRSYDRPAELTNPEFHAHRVLLSVQAQRQNKVPGFTELTKRVAADISVTALKLEKLQLCCTEK